MPNGTDIVVAGGGPAGCVAAIGLTGHGYRVRLITGSRRPAVEGLSERVLRALEQHGCVQARAAVGAVVQREASWNGARSAANLEWVVAREGFDAALQAAAAASGVEVHAAQITKVARDGESWRMESSAGTHRGDFLVEARGRRAPGRQIRGPATTAIGRLIEGAPRRPRTAVAGFPGGWAWYAADGEGAATLQIMVAPPVPPRRGLAAFFDAALGEVDEARGWLGGGIPVGAPWARAAETRRAAAPLEDRRIRVGDAALAMDPLSGHGVFEAIASATAAVPVIRTLFERPADGALAAAFYEERVRLAFERFARIGRDFYALEARWRDARFWRERRAWPDDRPAHRPPLAEPARIETRPVIAEGFVVARRVVVTADQPRGVWQVDGVSVVDLLDWVRANGPAATTAAARFARSERQIATALDWLRYRRLIG